MSRNRGVLTLTLDTPGSPVNIFNRATALQLCSILADVTPADTRAVVFETARPHSFINGVGLLLAQATRTREDVLAAAELPWAAYRAVHELAVPTIAVIQGNCFGCGVEFALNCDYRIAADRSSTCFYMTEVHDYAFLPLFGSTWNLPEAVGLAPAIELLLWGRRWDARDAFERGLIDEVSPAPELRARADAFVSRVIAGEQTSRKRGRIWQLEESEAAALAETAEDVAVSQVRARVAELPEQYRRVYGQALSLLEAGTRRRTSYYEHQARELSASADSALAPVGKAAYSFFYLRQIAAERAAGRSRGDDTPLRVRVDGGGHAAELARHWRERRLDDAELVEDGDAEIRLTDAGSAHANADGTGLDVTVTLSAGARVAGGVELYAPTFAAGGRIVELAAPAGADATAAQALLLPRLARTLQRFGLEVARTAPAQDLVSNQLVVSYLGPLVRFLDLGGDAASVDAVMHDMGFVQRPRDLVAQLGSAQLAPLVARHTGLALERVEAALSGLREPATERSRGSERAAGVRSEAGPVLIDALAVSMLAAVTAVRGRAEVRDTTILDLLARELLDFPRHLCSLCTWLRVERIERALRADPLLSTLAGEASAQAARAFVAAGREIYR